MRRGRRGGETLLEPRGRFPPSGLSARHHDIRFDFLPHADAWFDQVAQRLVEGFDVLICADNLQVDLHAPSGSQGSFKYPAIVGPSLNADL